MLWTDFGVPDHDVQLTIVLQELYTTSYDSIDWPAQRGNIAPGDIFSPHSKTLDFTLGEQCLNE